MSNQGTKDCAVYLFPHSESTNIYLVDTPGFDDTNMTDAEVLRHLADWLSFTYAHGIKLHGILYLHRITDVRMQGSARKNLIMFNKLCGEQALRKVALVTTMWENLKTQNEGENREKELRDKDEYWGWMSTRGSKIERHTNDPQSARRLVEMFVPSDKQKAPEEVALTIQKEMADQNKSLEDTKAGEVVCNSIEKERIRINQILEECRQSAREAILQRDTRRHQDLQEIMADTQQNEELLLRTREVLSADMEQMIKTRYDQAVAEMESEKLSRLSSQYSVRSGSRTDLSRTQTSSSETLAQPNSRPSLVPLRRHSTFKASQHLSLSLRGRHCSFLGPAYTKS